MLFFPNGVWANSKLTSLSMEVTPSVRGPGPKSRFLFGGLWGSRFIWGGKPNQTITGPLDLCVQTQKMNNVSEPKAPPRLFVWSLLHCWLMQIPLKGKTSKWTWTSPLVGTGAPTPCLLGGHVWRIGMYP